MAAFVYPDRAMLAPPTPSDEPQRLEALDTAPDEELDRITRTASRLFGVPIALVSLVDENRQWFKSRVGLDVGDTPRDVSFCGHAILGDDALIVENAGEDARFRDMVLDGRRIAFYAGQPIRSLSGKRLGTLCLIDSRPRRFTEDDADALRDLATLAERFFHRLEAGNELEHRLALRTAELETAKRELNREIHERERFQRSLSEEEERFSTILENATDAFIAVDKAGHIIEWNQSAERVFGWSRAEALGRPLAETVIPETLRGAHHDGFARFIRSGVGTIMNRRIEITARRRDGSVFPAELTLTSNHLGEQQIISAFLHDISERKAAENLLRKSRERLRLITDNMPALIAYVDVDLRYLFNNRAYEHWFGVPPEKLAGTPMRELLSETAFERALQGEQVTFENLFDCRLGRIDVTTTLIPNAGDDGKIEGFYVLSLDVTERKRLMSRLEQEASLDALTELPNRRAFMRQLSRAITGSRRNRSAFALLFIDLDGFKRLNDGHGHDFGDAVLKRFADILTGALRQTDTVARLAGDEFTVILEGLDTPASAAPAVAAKLLDTLSAVREIDGRPVTLSASIGVALHHPASNATPDSLLAAADRAMYEAKQSGKNRYALSVGEPG
ncbi:diguanylate cyclase [Crenobacter cavernae]|uniref:Diguanylate cyclase n=2 Tax=Crenobacter cavernae TaxID=2290923 RepID=A0A345Y434_9NEIS|nr:diguanylate cyclase [Crenobacter cavernae]